jgi:arylsulfatase A-like enzyme
MPTRRHFLKTAAAAAALALPARLARGGPSPQTTPPNILWLTFEDTSAAFLGCYGCKSVRTPRLDRLAATGVRFTSAFSSAPVCSPSRHAIITGCAAATTGAGNHRSRVPLPAGIKGFPFYLRQAGYFTTNNLKTDYNIAAERRFADEAFHQNFGAGAWATSNDPRPQPETYDQNDREAGWWRRPAGQPFFSIFNLMASHQSRTMTKPRAWFEKNVLARLPAGAATRPGDVELPPFYRDTPEMRRHFSRVCDSINLLDLQIGRILDRLDADGLAASTIIFAFADHGEGIPRAKTASLALGCRVPFIIHFPEKLRHLSPWPLGAACDELISSSEDPAPTILSLAGLKPPAHMTGRALLGPRRAPPRPFVFSARDRIDESPDLARSATDGRFFYTRVFMPRLPVVKYIKYSDVSDISRAIRADHAAGKLDALQSTLYAPSQPPEHLYDLQNDPWETRNLAADPARLATLQKFRAALHTRLLATRDIHFLPEYDLARRAAAAGATPRAFRENDRDYPVARILAAAALSGAGPAAAPRQLRLLSDPDSTVRHWAAIGLDAQRAPDPAHLPALAAALDDPHPCVQITIAGILYKRDRNPRAAEILKNHLQGRDEYLALQTLQTIQYMHPAAAALLPAVQSLRARLKKRNGGFHDTAAALKRHLYDIAAICDMILHTAALAPLQAD